MKPHYTNTNNPIDFPKSENKMNERIRDLQIQAFAECKTFEGDKIKTDEVFERFAELIVRECISTIENAENGYLDYRNQIEDDMRNHCISLIKNEFGVEE